MTERTAEEIQDFLKNYNWDDGVEDVSFLLDEPHCEFGNALLFYWMMEGEYSYFTRYENDEHKELLLKLENRLLNGFYSKGKIRYLPIQNFQLFKTQVYLLKKKGLPKELIEPEYNSNL